MNRLLLPAIIAALLAATAPAQTDSASPADSESAAPPAETRDNSAESIDDLLGLPSEAPGDQGAAEQKNDAADEAEAPLELTPDVEQKLTGEQAADTFAEAVSEMNTAAQRLAETGDSGIQTQRLQKAILDKLDQVIAHARQQSDGSGEGAAGEGSASPQEAGSRQNTGRSDSAGQRAAAAEAARQTSPSKGDASPGEVTARPRDAAAIDETRTEWGHLPPRLRSELMQGLDEPYSALYRDLTEAYYRRLAEEPTE